MDIFERIFYWLHFVMYFVFGICFQKADISFLYVLIDLPLWSVSGVTSQDLVGPAAPSVRRCEELSTTWVNSKLIPWSTGANFFHLFSFLILEFYMQLFRSPFKDAARNNNKFIQVIQDIFLLEFYIIVPVDNFYNHKK